MKQSLGETANDSGQVAPLAEHTPATEFEYHTFSVVIATYKRANLLAKAIDSVFKQNYPKDKYEVVVIYTPSGDGTEVLLEGYQGNSPVPISYYAEMRKAVSCARNLGVEKSRLEFVAQLDDDAIACPDWLATFNQVINEHHAMVVGGRIEIYFDEGCTPPDWFNYPYIYGFFGLNYGERGRKQRVVRSRYPLTLYAHNTAYAKRLFEHFGGYRTDLGPDGKSFKFGEETFFNMVLDRNDIPIYYADDAYIHHYVSADRIDKAYFLNRAYWSGVTHAYVYRLFFGYEEAFKRTKNEWSELWLKIRQVIQHRGSPENFSRICRIICLVTWLTKFYLDYATYKLSTQTYTPPQVTWTTQNWIGEIARWSDSHEKYEQLYQLYLTAGEIEGAQQALAKLETYPPADRSKNARAHWKELSTPWRLQYEQLVRQLRDVVEATVPQQGTVLVVSKGDGKLLKLNGRRAWHFPQDDHGKYAGYNPADSAAAIAQFETLRRKGADFIVFPSTAFWWLEHYGKFRQHLMQHYRAVVRQEDTCLIFDLRAPGGKQPNRVRGAISTSIKDQFTDQTMLPPQVALTAEYWIKEISGWPEGVTKYMQLHYLFLTVGDTARAEEALRQATERLPPMRTEKSQGLTAGSKSVDTLTDTEIHSIKGLEKLGSAYGGWIVPTLDISEGAVCYLAGVGEDITFDLALIARFNCSVFAFDPTPRAKLHVHKQAAHLSQFHFFNFGLWDAEGMLKFYAPANSEHVSHSIVNLQNSDRYFEASCKRLSAIMREMGHSRIQLLKLDIEGAEYRVIDSLVEDRLDIGIICVEYHAIHNDADDEFPGQIKKSVARLCEIGYALVAVEPNLNYTFVKESFLSQ